MTKTIKVLLINNLVTLGSNATSRVEGVNGKVKPYIPKKSSMHGCLTGIFSYLHSKNEQKDEIDYYQSIKTLKFINKQTPSDIIDEVQSICTPWATKIIINNIESANLCSYSLIKELENAISITSKNVQYLIKHLNICSCFEFNNLLLSCKNFFL